jgi:heparosan-N-sulfate-glucuronate 5-epimerase
MLRFRRFLILLQRYISPSSSVGFWHMKVTPRHYDFPTLEGYYLDMTPKCTYLGPRDAAGIPMLDYKDGREFQYNPCATAQYALGFWQRLCEGDESAREPFITCAEWLLRELTPVEGGGDAALWYYRFGIEDISAYGVTHIPFPSGLAQAQGLQVLLRYRKLAPSPMLDDAIRRAYAGLILPIEKGGVWREADLGCFIEEIPSPTLSCILDGYMFAILGVADYSFATGDDDSCERLKRLYETLALILPRFDLGYWSRMDLWSARPIPASPFYHAIHISQLQSLFALSGRLEFNHFAQRWQAYAAHPAYRIRALLTKIYCKLVYY